VRLGGERERQREAKRKEKSFPGFGAVMKKTTNAALSSLEGEQSDRVKGRCNYKDRVGGREFVKGNEGGRRRRINKSSCRAG